MVVWPLRLFASFSSDEGAGGGLLISPHRHARQSRQDGSPGRPSKPSRGCRHLLTRGERTRGTASAFLSACLSAQGGQTTWSTPRGGSVGPLATCWPRPRPRPRGKPARVHHKGQQSTNGPISRAHVLMRLRARTYQNSPDRWRLGQCQFVIGRSSAQSTVSCTAG
ncbi:unnamed protein product [Protopolystoma xenopodis]|uniref:Uncharacterized protein n=1 Tax=Protopolystoma xenopodis TaxID=117903 RepID=A0A3S5AJV7_9PLAT|nr:unnamed protein product [Protopolystoma xenopodis]